MPSAKRKRDSEGEEEEGFESDYGGDEDVDEVAIMLMKVLVDFDTQGRIRIMVPSSFYGNKIGLEFVFNRLRSEMNWDEEFSKKGEILDPTGEDYTAMMLVVSFIASPLPPNAAGRKVVPFRGPSYAEVFGDVMRVEEVGENSCSVILPMSFINQSVDVHYELRGFRKVKKAWETAGAGNIKFKGNVNSHQPLMFQTIINSIYS